MSTHGGNVLRVALPRRPRTLRLHAGGGGSEPDAAPQRGRQLSALAQKTQRDAIARDALMSCIRSIEQHLEGIPAQVNENLAQVSALVTEIGLAVAREVVGTALDHGLVDITAAVRRCLDQAVAGADTGRMRIRLSPDDLGTLIQSLDAHPDLRERMRGVDLLPDPGVERGHVRVETDAGSLVYDPREVAARISDGLRRAEQEARGGAS